jgi:hypothetical protein
MKTDEIPNAVDTEALNKYNVINSKWRGLSDDEKFIMGMPNFQCAGIAHRLRDMGIDCNRKAEDEQALAILTMLHFYKEYGQNWKTELVNFINRDGA